MQQSMHSLPSSGHQTPNLSRSNTLSRINLSPKCFGTTQYVHKDDYERERQRWQQKLDEAEGKLIECTVTQAGLAQVKAELNKKIVEFEKNQRPLVDQNKRLNDRNRIIQNELKKVEEKLSHAQDDYLTLKDTYDRIIKENASLKEQRAFPEKLKELDRYRNQVLEYSKCINALRQAGLEKDRRYELLVQKFKRMKKCLLKKSEDDDRQSSHGSEGSAESSINLDKIAEDIDESLEIDPSSYSYDQVVTFKLHSLLLTEEQLLKDQLEAANSTIAELQMALTAENLKTARVSELTTTVSKQKEDIQKLIKERNDLKAQLSTVQQSLEVTEFELNEVMAKSLDDSKSTAKIAHQETETDEFVNDEALESVFEDIKAFVQMDQETINLVKEQMQRLRKLACLKAKERDALKKALQHIENLENKLSFAETELNMTNCELKRVESSRQDDINSLTVKIHELSSNTSKRKKELQSALETSKKELSQATSTIRAHENEISSLRKQLSELEAASAAQQDLQSKCETLQLLLDESKAQHKADIQSYVDKLNEQITKNELVTSELDSAKKLCAELTQTAETLTADVNESRKERSNDDERLRGIQSDFASIKKEYEAELEKKNAESDRLAMENEKLTAECQKLKQKIAEMEHSLEVVKSEQSNTMIAHQEKLTKELENAQAEIVSLRDLLQPAEREIVETRARLAEINRQSENYQTQLAQALTTIVELEAFKQEDENRNLEIQQLKAYNNELENQFNTQMDLIATLKKKFLELNNNTGIQKTQCTRFDAEDEQYHSEASSVESFTAIRNAT